MLDGAEIIGRLWQGALPDDPDLLEPFDLLVTVGPRPRALPPGVEHHHYGFIDPLWDSDFGVGERYLALSAAALVVGRHRAGARVLVCCAQGLNRSGYVVALALMVLRAIDGKQAVKAVQRRRPGALYNPVLTEVLEGAHP